ncbi:MAG: hypothetical protein AAF206_27480 [Bacteroidota bacterium]
MRFTLFCCLTLFLSCQPKQQPASKVLLPPPPPIDGFTIPSSSRDLTKTIDSLQFVTDMPYICEGDFGCGDPLFWQAVMGKEQAIPLLLDKIRDSSLTRASVPNFGGHYAVGDVAYFALTEIIHPIETFDLLPVDFDQNGCGFCSYWQHLQADLRHRVDFEQAIRDWLSDHQGELIWQTSQAFRNCDCHFPHPNAGHFVLQEDKP